MAHRDFPITPSKADPPSFSVAGHEFKALPEPPGGALGDLFWAMSGDTAKKMAGAISFIGMCLPDEAAEEFELLIHSKDVIVTTDVLLDITTWLVEAYTDRPTTPFSGLDAGSPPTPATSGDGADSPASTSPEPDSAN